eukprot:1163293-Pyramimonas_sp.AAC.1
MANPSPGKPGSYAPPNCGRRPGGGPVTRGLAEGAMVGKPPHSRQACATFEKQLLTNGPDPPRG